jgi:hypothetical protein
MPPTSCCGKVYFPGHDVFYFPDIDAANAAPMQLDKWLVNAVKQ